jgi:hypothetical protein
MYFEDTHKILTEIERRPVKDLLEHLMDTGKNVFLMGNHCDKSGYYTGFKKAWTGIRMI